MLQDLDHHHHYFPFSFFLAALNSSLLRDFSISLLFFWLGFVSFLYLRDVRLLFLRLITFLPFFAILFVLNAKKEKRFFVCVCVCAHSMYLFIHIYMGVNDDVKRSFQGFFSSSF